MWILGVCPNVGAMGAGEEGGGRASVSAPQSSNEGSGLPRVDFPEEAPDEGLEEIGWGDETLTLARG